MHFPLRLWVRWSNLGEFLKSLNCQCSAVFLTSSFKSSWTFYQQYLQHSSLWFRLCSKSQSPQAWMRAGVFQHCILASYHFQLHSTVGIVGSLTTNYVQLISIYFYCLLLPFDLCNPADIKALELCRVSASYSSVYISFISLKVTAMMMLGAVV